MAALNSVSGAFVPGAAHQQSGDMPHLAGLLVRVALRSPRYAALEYDVRELRPVARYEGRDLRGIGVAGVTLTPEELGELMLEALDESLGAGGFLVQPSCWTAQQHAALAEVAISVAEQIQGSDSSQADLDAELEVATSAGNQGPSGVAAYLIRRLDLAGAWQTLSEFATEYLTESESTAERPGA